MIGGRGLGEYDRALDRLIIPSLRTELRGHVKGALNFR
jgi:hypothetical protein